MPTIAACVEDTWRSNELSISASSSIASPPAVPGMPDGSDPAATAARRAPSASSHAASCSRASWQAAAAFSALIRAASASTPMRSNRGRAPRSSAEPASASRWASRTLTLSSLIWVSHSRAAASVSSAPRALRVADRNCLWRVSLPAASARGSASAWARSTRSRSVS
jgi:hypothetical protein